MIVGIVGAGAMGSGIAQVAAMSGCEVRIFDTNTQSISNALVNIGKSIQKFVQKGMFTPDQAVAIHGSILPCEQLKSFSDCDVVIEAIIEDLNIKKSVFAELEGYVSDDCILASNTSSLSITSIASVLAKPRRFLGIHFFNPPVIMKLVEIIPALQTDEEVTQKAFEILSSWGKLSVLAKDTPGFIVNKVARPYYSEAIRMFEEGLASMEDIDKAMLAVGFKMGPFTLMDFIGHDVNYKVTESVWRSFYFDSRYRPSITQCRLLEAGYLGRKSGQGFYKYLDTSTPEFEAKENLYLSNRILAMLVNEAADTVSLGIASPEDIDCAVVNGLNYPRGLFEWINVDGADKFIGILDQLHTHYREERYRISPYLLNMSKKNRT
jgi:3-hydroxybutyryl-CoA dehydrogenase